MDQLLLVHQTHIQMICSEFRTLSLVYLIKVNNPSCAIFSYVVRHPFNIFADPCPMSRWKKVAFSSLCHIVALPRLTINGAIPSVANMPSVFEWSAMKKLPLQIFKASVVEIFQARFDAPWQFLFPEVTF